jgi:electron transfer flavoprotein beta subunit
VGFNFLCNRVCIESFTVNSDSVKCSREISGGIETSECKLPIVIGAQKGLVEESDLIIPNMRGIMMARQKPLEVMEPKNFSAQSVDNKFFKPEEKGEVKLINADEIDKLIDLLENEAKVL